MSKEEMENKIREVAKSLVEEQASLLSEKTEEMEGNFQKSLEDVQ
jgi:hypothetical protein